jgi:hypothetical protein
MILKRPIYPDRIRKITGSFSWVDHRLISDYYLQQMTCFEIPLYFFLVLVGDKQGLSFYSDASICELLKIESVEYYRARERLIDRSLIAYNNGLFQVLQLPDSLGSTRSNKKDFSSLKEIMQSL